MSAAGGSEGRKQVPHLEGAGASLELRSDTESVGLMALALLLCCSAQSPRMTRRTQGTGHIPGKQQPAATG